MKKQISVVIPTYRRPQLLTKCLHALFNQTLSPTLYDVIVVSDGYDDSTEKLVHEMKHVFSDRLFYLHTEVKKGPAAARNYGWLFSNSQLVAFTDDDCIPDSKWLEELYRVYHGELHMAYTGYVQVPIAKKPTDYEKNVARLEEAEFITANCACTKEALYFIGGFDERFEMAWREDSDLHFKFLRYQVPIVHIPTACVVHPVRKAKWGISLKEQKKGIYNALLFKKFPELYRQRIATHTSYRYYLLLLLLILMLTSGLIRAKVFFIASAVAWMGLTAAFILFRLKGTRKTIAHIVEMVVTSILIPYVSIYWKIYGWVKYKVIMF